MVIREKSGRCSQSVWKWITSNSDARRATRSSNEKMPGYWFLALRIKPSGARADGIKHGSGHGIATCEERDIMAQHNQLVGEVGYNPFRAAIQPGRNAFGERSNLRYSHGTRPLKIWDTQEQREARAPVRFRLKLTVELPRCRAYDHEADTFARTWVEVGWQSASLIGNGQPQAPVEIATAGDPDLTAFCPAVGMLVRVPCQLVHCCRDVHRGQARHLKRLDINLAEQAGHTFDGGCHVHEQRPKVDMRVRVRRKQVPV